MKNFRKLLLNVLCSFSIFELAAQNASTSKSETYQGLDWCETYSDSIKEAKTSSKPLLILFTGTAWCPACMRLERSVINKPDFIKAIGDKFVFYKAEFNQPTAQAMENSPDKFLMDRYQVTQFPTMVIVDGDGKELFKVDYQSGGVSAYTNALNQKLAQKGLNK